MTKPASCVILSTSLTQETVAERAPYILANHHVRTVILGDRALELCGGVSGWAGRVGSGPTCRHLSKILIEGAFSSEQESRLLRRLKSHPALQAVEAEFVIERVAEGELRLRLRDEIGPALHDSTVAAAEDTLGGIEPTEFARAMESGPDALGNLLNRRSRKPE
jgi:hypothetical protein